MTNRRKVLAQLAAGAAALPSVALGATAHEPHAHDSSCDCVRPHNGPYADYFPNVVVQTHEGRQALFYNDLLRGKTVLVNCMSVRGDDAYPVTANLVRVQRLLGERMGRDVFFYSISIEPEHDTPRVLAAFAERQGVGPGWLFLTGKPDAIELVRGRLFAHDGHKHGAAAAPARDCSRGLVRYGNERVGLWASVPAKTEPEWIVKRLSWVTPRAVAAGPSIRRGPTFGPANSSRPKNSGGAS
ncbi:MAG: SCO family protein [Acidobacteria bacterium]|nr:SCO family protein [Acidobacteriota bacterium]